MRILCPVVQPFMLAMITRRQSELPTGCSIGAKLVDYHDPRSAAAFREQFPDQTLGGLCVSAALYKDFQHETILIDGPP